MITDLNKAVSLLKQSSYTSAFTGAGISVESGVPPFRGENGLWNKYDPMVLDIDYFHSYPLESWKVIREIFYEFFEGAKPNKAHEVLAQMEKEKLLFAVITQNIDNLHQEAGSKVVYEYHGNAQKLVCTKCGKYYKPSEVDLNNLPPRCSRDNVILKPDFVFFGEPIPEKAREGSMVEAVNAEVFLVIGSTGEVMPACFVPQVAKKNGAVIIEINPEESQFTHSITDIYLKGKAAGIMEEIAKKLWE
ncbi:MAG: NAD-dependent deacylase [Bacteroidetes bacterium]|nr:NAD-dependent deacylase [Bacteroidota bacterium]